MNSEKDIQLDQFDPQIMQLRKALFELPPTSIDKKFKALKERSGEDLKRYSTKT